MTRSDLTFEVLDGAKAIHYADAHWGPVACSEHEEGGHKRGCEECRRCVAKAVEHITAVVEQEARAAAE